MAQCKYCGSTGWFNVVDNNGLCKTCQTLYLQDIVNRCRIVIESGKIIRNSKKIETILSRIDVSLENLEMLKRYDAKGIPTLTAKPHEVIRQMIVERESAIDRFVHEQQILARSAVESASTPTGKLGGYKKAIDRLNKLLLEVQDVAAIEIALAQLVAERDMVRAKNSINKAEALAEKGKIKQAVEVLIDARTELRQDTTPDNEQRHIFLAIDQMIGQLERTSLP